MTSWQNESIVFYSRMAELQHKLKKSEEERLDLEKKFNLILHSCQAEQEAKIKSLRNTYTKLLEDDRMRCERNDTIMQTLKKVENRASMITTKTDRLRLLRHHYEAYMSRLYPDWKKELGNTNNVIPQIINSDTANIHTEYMGNISLFDPLNPTKSNYFNNLPLRTQSNGKTTETSPENVPLETYKLSSLESPHVQITSNNTIQNKLDMPPKPYQLRRKLFEDIPINATISDELLYQRNYNSQYESFTPTKSEGYIAPEQNRTESNIIHNGKVGDFEMDQNTSDLLSATLSDDSTIPKEAKPYDFNHTNLAHSPFMHTNKRYSEVNNNENKYSKSTSTPISYTPPGLRKPLARTSSFDFPSKSDQENDRNKKSLLTRRPSILTDNIGILNKNIRNHSFPKSLINENNAMDSRFKKYLMDTERPYNIRNTYEPRKEITRYTDKINEMMEKERDHEHIKPITDIYEDDRLQTIRSYDNRSVHFEPSPLVEDEQLKDSGNSYNKYMNKSSKQPNSVRNSEPIWHEALKINDNIKPENNHILNSTKEDSNIQDEKNKSIFNFHISNSKPVPQRQPVVQNSFSTPSFLFTEYKSSDDVKDGKRTVLEDTEDLPYPVRPNKEKLQEISQEECMQFPKEKILEQFPEHTSEQFYRLQVVAEHPQEEANELKTSNEKIQSKLSSDHKHNPIEDLQKININEHFKHTYDPDSNTKYQSQTELVNENAHSSKNQSCSLGTPIISSKDSVEISKSDNKFYENAIEQLRIETQKSENLLGSNILEQEPNKDKTGQSSSIHETKILGPEHISKIVSQEGNISNSNNSIMNNSGCEEKCLVDNTQGYNIKDINKNHESPQKDSDNQLDFFYNNETNSKQMENTVLFELKQKVKSNEKPPVNSSKSNFTDDTNDMANKLKIMNQLFPKEIDVKSDSGNVEKDILTCDDLKEEIRSDNVKFNAKDDKPDSENFSVSNIQDTNVKEVSEENQNISDYKTSETNKDSVQFSKENETNLIDNNAATENNSQVTMQCHEYTTADSKEFTEGNAELKYNPIISNNGEENVTALEVLEEHIDKINKHEGDTYNELDTGIQNVYNDQLIASSISDINENQHYSDNKEHQNEELAINTHEHLDESEQVPAYSSELNEHEQVFDNVNQQYSDRILEENKDFKSNPTVHEQQLDDGSRHYENYYPENQNENYINQQYYTDQQEEYYPDQNVEGTEYANYSNGNDDQYKSYVGKNNETDQYVSDQYGSQMNYQYVHNDKNEYEQQQENYQVEFDDTDTYRKQDYDETQQYDQEGTYQEPYGNSEQYEQQGGYNLDHYEQQEGAYNTSQYEQEEGNYQQNYEDGEHYLQQEGDYQHQYEQDYDKNYENGNQYEQQEGEYNESQYEQQEGDYQQDYNGRNQFVQQGNYEQNYDQYESYNLPEESNYRSNMQPSDSLQDPGATYSYSAERNELQDDIADHNFRQDLETDEKVTMDEQLQPNVDDADKHLRKQRSLAKVLESDSDSVNLGKDQYNDDSSDFDFSSHNERNNT